MSCGIASASLAWGHPVISFTQQQWRHTASVPSALARHGLMGTARFLVTDCDHDKVRMSGSRYALIPLQHALGLGGLWERSRETSLTHGSGHP